MTDQTKRLGARRLPAILIVVGLVALCGIIAASWWIPKAAFACNGVPWGPSSAQEAAEGFAESVVAGDEEGVCSFTSSSLASDSGMNVVKAAAETLGHPARAADITITLSEQMGSTTTATLRTTSGEVALNVQAHAGQWRVIHVDY